MTFPHIRRFVMLLILICASVALLECAHKPVENSIATPTPISTPAPTPVRVSFSQVFQTNPDGSISPRSRVRIGSAEFGPGASFRPGVAFSGVDIAAMAGRDLAITRDGDIVVIVRVY
ncbi:MAG: hypothetical protein ACREDR_12290 [Blastocatellia bacterium]